MEFVGPKTKEEINDYLKTRIDSLGFSKKVENALIMNGIMTIGGIIRKDGYFLSEIDEIDLIGIEEIKRSLLESFEINISNKKGNHEYLIFKPKYNELKELSPNLEYKKQTEEDDIRKEFQIIEEKKLSRQNDIKFIGSKTKEEINDYLKTRVGSLSFSNRLENSLLRASIRTIGGIIRKNDDALYYIDGVGLKGIEEIIDKLSDSFEIVRNGKNIRFIPKYNEVTSPYQDISKEQTEEARIKIEIKKKEFEIIENKYFEKQKEREFIHQIKISSLGIDQKIETILLSNSIITVGDLLKETLQNFKEKHSLTDEEINLILDIFNYLILKDTQVEDVQEKLRTDIVNLMGYLPHRLEKKEFNLINKNIKVDPRDLKIFNSFRKGLTLEQIGKENNVTRERVRQVLKKTLNKMSLDYNDERKNIIEKRRELKPQKIKKEKWWSRDFKECISCKKTEYKHIRYGLCEKCAGHFSGTNRENIIIQHNNKCDLCGLSREETRNLYGRDFYISKDMNVFCKKCHLIKTGKTLGDSRKNKWKMFYK